MCTTREGDSTLGASVILLTAIPYMKNNSPQSILLCLSTCLKSLENQDFCRIQGVGTSLTLTHMICYGVRLWQLALPYFSR